MPSNVGALGLNGWCILFSDDVDGIMTVSDSWSGKMSGMLTSLARLGKSFFMSISPGVFASVSVRCKNSFVSFCQCAMRAGVGEFLWAPLLNESESCSGAEE